jgi:hypothetical protein
MKVRVNVADVTPIEYDDGVILQVKVLSWDERKTLVLRFLESLPDEGNRKDVPASSIIELRDGVVRASVCGWSGIKGTDGNEIPFDRALIGRLEPWEAIAEDVMEAAMPGFNRADVARAAREIEAEGEDSKN